MMTFQLLAPTSKRWFKGPQLKVDFVTFIVQSYFDTLLRYMLSVTFCGAIVLKVMGQKTLVKRKLSYKGRITIYT